MKICATIILLLFHVQSSLSQDYWTALPNAPVAEGRFDDVFFINPLTGWIVNVGEGTIYKTSDGGTSWTKQLTARDDIGFHVGFRSIGFATSEIGWAGNLNSHSNPVPGRSLFETRNGGQTWRNISDRISGPDPAGLCGLWVHNESLIYGVGRWNGPAIFVKSTDGGVNWTSQNLQPLVSGLVDVFFFSPDSGIVVGGRGIGSSIEEQEASHSVILFTGDGGSTWDTRYISQASGKNCWKISFPTPDTGFVATQGTTADGVVLKTTDRGRSWQEKVVGPDLGFSGIGFISSEHGWVGEDQTYETTDGGDTWHEVTNVGRRINRFRMVNARLGFAVGETVYRFLDDQSTAVSQAVPALPTDYALDQNYPNPFNPSTVISYSLNKKAAVHLAVYDLTGRHVVTLVNRDHDPGTYKTGWDGRDQEDQPVASGVYLYTISTTEFTQTRKMILLH